MELRALLTWSLLSATSDKVFSIAHCNAMNLRLDRIATLYVVSPLRRLTPRREASIPILMYHSISGSADRLHGYYGITTTPAIFAAQMESLHASGFRTCSLGEAIDQLNGAASTASKSVVLTFDDGYADFYRQAFPVMNRFGFTATVFLPTAFISGQRVQFLQKDCLTWSEVRELHQNGIRFGSHTVTHPRLRELSTGAINDELVNSKNVIEEKLGAAADSFAYPYAFPQADANFKRVLRELLQEAGYQNGVSTIVGRASRKSDPLFIERLPVNSFDDLALFRAKLAGAYDWIAIPQRFTKMAKTKVANLRSQPLNSVFSSSSLRS